MCIRDMFNLLEPIRGLWIESKQHLIRLSRLYQTITVFNALRHRLSHMAKNVQFIPQCRKWMTITIQPESSKLRLQQSLSKPLFFISDQCQFSWSRLFFRSLLLDFAFSRQIKAFSKAKYLL